MPTTGWERLEENKKGETLHHYPKIWSGWVNNKPEDIAGKKSEKGKILRKKYLGSLGKILAKTKKGSHIIFFKNSEKYSTKIGKILQEIWKNTPVNPVIDKITFSTVPPDRIQMSRVIPGKLARLIIVMMRLAQSEKYKRKSWWNPFDRFPEIHLVEWEKCYPIKPVAFSLVRIALIMIPWREWEEEIHLTNDEKYSWQNKINLVGSVTEILLAG